MTAWTSEELGKTGDAEELRVASRRRDGTPRNPLPVWVVRHGDDLDVRPVNGADRRRWMLSRALMEKHVGAFLA